MSVKVFVLGRPGSGKTTATRHIGELAQRRGFTTCRLKDYDILYQMFQHDDGQNFRPAEYGGFDVLNLSVFDTALEQLEKDVEAVLCSPQTTDIITIEFARDDYTVALSTFSPGFLHDSYFFFVDANLESCIERIYRRLSNPPKPDCHFVSEYIMRTYYDKENDWEGIASDLKRMSGTSKEVTVFRNIGSLEELLRKASSFVESIISQELLLPML